MASSIKLFLPVAIAVSPLLLAAATPTLSDELQLSCGLSSASSRDVMLPPVQSANSQGHIVHPIAASPQALVTSAHEWSAILLEAAQDAQIRATPTSLAFVEAAVSAVPTQAQTRCNRKEEPTETPTTSPVEAADNIPNLDPSALPPASPAPAPPAPMPPVTPSPEAVTPEPSPENQPADALPNSSDPAEPTAAPTAAPTLSIPSRPISPPPEDPTIDPTNVTPTSEPAAPFDGVVVPTLETLPDGVYRYLSGNYEYGIYSNEQLIANGGAVFLLTKTGDRVVGNFYPTLGQSGVCVDGTLRGNSIVGPAYLMDPVPPSSAASETEDSDDATAVAEAYVPYSGLASFQVRQPQVVGDRLFYAESLLDLSEYSRINAGTSLAPTGCDVPSAAPEPGVETESAE